MSSWASTVRIGRPLRDWLSQSFLCIYCLCQSCFTFRSSAPERNDISVIRLWKRAINVEFDWLWQDGTQLSESAQRTLQLRDSQSTYDSHETLEYQRNKKRANVDLFMHDLICWRGHMPNTEGSCKQAAAGLKGHMLIFMVTSHWRIRRLHMQTEVWLLWPVSLKQLQELTGCASSSGIIYLIIQFYFCHLESNRNTRSSDYDRLWSVLPEGFRIKRSVLSLSLQIIWPQTGWFC